MSPEECIAALDRGLVESGEDIILRRVVGTGTGAANIDVGCRAKVTSLRDSQLAAGIKETEQNVILSPTQINAAQWPGGSAPQLPPFDVDQRIPRMAIDKAIVQKRLRTVTFSEPVLVDNILVRINLRVSG